jgi:outer membrane immunogenic protein
MKKLLMSATVAIAALTISGAGQAADLPVTPPPMVAPLLSPFSWTGFYIGGNVGGTWADRQVTDALGRDFGRSNDGVVGVLIGGGQVGFNYQMGWFVLGVEADFEWVNSSTDHPAGVPVPLVGTIAASAHDRWISTVAARLGYALDHFLLYAKLGGGWVGVSNLTITNQTTGASITGSSSRSESGFLVGGGIEYAFTNNWTVKAEYEYLGLSSRTFVVPAGAPFFVGNVFTTPSRHVDELKVGLNYLFNVARY